MLRFLDSFDAGPTKWSASAGAVRTTGVVRTGAAALFCSGGFEATSATLAVSGATAIIGFAFRVSTLGAGDFLQILEGSTIHIALETTALGAIKVQRNNTDIESSANGVLAINNWYYIEVKVVINDTTGTYEVRVDGVSVVDGTGADTQNGGTSTWNTIKLWGPQNNTYFDDFYACDGSGGSSDNFLGNSKVLTKLPSTDAVAAGTYSDFTPSTGSDNGAMVDEAVPDDDTTYNVGTTAGQKDTYNYTALADGGTIKGLLVSMHVRKTDAGARTVAPVIRRGVTNYNGTTVSPATTYASMWEVFEEDPSTSAIWTESGIDAAEFGMEIIT